MTFERGNRDQPGSRRQSQVRAFTLLEVLLATAVAGLLIVVAIFTFRNVTQNSSATINTVDLRLINGVLETYKFKNPSSPLLTGANDTAQHSALLTAMQAMPESPFKYLQFDPAKLTSTGAGQSFRFTAYEAGSVAQVTGSGSGGGSGSGSSLSSSEVVLNGLGMTSLTGAGSTTLAGYATAGLVSGSRIVVGIGGQQSIYELADSVGPQALPTIVQPNDYAAGSNQRMWLQRFYSGTLLTANNLSEFAGNSTAQTAARGNLALGSIATQNANAVNITGGVIVLANGGLTIGSQIVSGASSLALSGKMAGTLLSSTTFAADGSTVGAGVTFAGGRNYSLFSTLATAPLGSGYMVLADPTTGTYRWAVSPLGLHGFGGTVPYIPTATVTVRGDGTNPVFDAQKADGTSALKVNANGSLNFGVLAGTAGNVAVDAAGNVSVSTSSGTSGEWVHLSTLTASNSASVDFTGLGSTYSDFELRCIDVVPANVAVGNFFGLQISRDGGSSWVTQYRGGYFNVVYNPAHYYENSMFPMSTGASTPMSGVARVMGADLNIKTVFEASFHAESGGNGYGGAQKGGGYASSAGTVNGLRVRFSSGNISSGTFQLFGRRVPGPPSAVANNYVLKSGDIMSGDLVITRGVGTGGPKLRLDATAVGSGGKIYDIKSTTSSDAEGAGRLVVIDTQTGVVRFSVDSNGLTTRGTGGTILKAENSAGATRFSVADDGTTVATGSITGASLNTTGSTNTGALNATGAVKFTGVGGAGSLVIDASGNVSSQAASVPAGTVVRLHVSKSAPTGYLLCNGSLINPATYPNLANTGGSVLTKTSTTLPSTHTFSSQIAFGNGVFVVVGESNSQNDYFDAFVSIDGLTWEGPFSLNWINNATIEDLIFDGEQFIAWFRNSSNYYLARSSPNGRSFTFLYDPMQMVASYYDGPIRHINTSDGRLWCITLNGSGVPTYVNRSVWSNGKFDYRVNNSNSVYFKEGATGGWTYQGVSYGWPQAFAWAGAKWILFTNSNVLGRPHAVGGQWQYGSFGFTWNYSQQNRVAFANGYYLASDGNGRLAYALSPEGSWTEITQSAPLLGGPNLLFGNGYFVTCSGSTVIRATFNPGGMIRLPESPLSHHGWLDYIKY